MKKKSWLFVLIFMGSTALAQKHSAYYQTAVGIKFFPGAVTAKHFISNHNALEGVAYFWDYGVRVTGLYEIHKEISDVDGLQWYIGPGAHVGFWNSNWAAAYPNRATGMNLGIDGVLGLDYKVNDLPLNISIDWQPSINLVGYSYFQGGWGGIGLRYTIE